MKIIYLMRHGESLANLDGTVGVPYIALSAKGIKQAQKRAKEFVNVPLVLCHSSFKRSKDTAYYFKNRIGIRRIPEFNERFFGSLEYESGQKQLKELKKHLDNLSKTERAHIRYVQDMESDLDAYFRFMKGMRKVLDDKEQNFLIISHSNIMRIFLVYTGLLIFEQLPAGSIENTGYFKLSWDGEKFKLLVSKGVKIK